MTVGRLPTKRIIQHRLPGHRRTLIVVAILGLALSALGAESLLASSADVAAIRSVVTNAMVATQYLPSRTAQNAAAAQGVSGAAWASQIDNELAKYYAGDVLTRKIDIAHQAIVGGDGVPVVDNAGVRDITFEAVTIAGSQAYVQTEGLSWATLRQTSAADAPSASPTDLVDWTFTLVKESDGSWRIIGEDWQFAPGSEP